MRSDDLNFAPTVKASRGRLFRGLAAGALAGTGASVITDLLDNLAFHAGARSTLVSPLIPLGVLVLCAFVFLPLIWSLLNIVPKRLAIFLPPVVIAACCAVYVVLFSGNQARLTLLGISTFSYVLLPFLAASVVAAWVWIHPEPNSNDVAPL